MNSIIRTGGSITMNGVVMWLERHDFLLWLVISWRCGENEERFVRLPIDRDGWDAIKKFMDQ